MSEWARYLRLNWHINGCNIAFFALNWVFLVLYADTLDSMLSYNSLKWLYLLHNITDQLPRHIGLVSMTQRTKNREKIEVCRSKNLENWGFWNSFYFFLMFQRCAVSEKYFPSSIGSNALGRKIQAQLERIKATKRIRWSFKTWFCVGNRTPCCFGKGFLSERRCKCHFWGASALHDSMV